jgi:hypothetical protein
MAALIVDETDGPLLIYEFINDHRKVAYPNLSIHRGLTRLTMIKEKKSQLIKLIVSKRRKKRRRNEIK